MTEWYLGDDWSQKTKEEFEQKLKKSRGDYNKAQYLRIKGSSLLESKDPQKNEAGCELLNRVINEYPKEISNVMFAYEQLGDYYFKQVDYTKAKNNYRQSISFYKENGRSGSSGIGDVKLAETIIKAGKSDDFLAMYHLLTDEFKKTGGALTLNDDIFRYYSVLAKISDAIGKKDEAKAYAQKALQLTEITKPQLDDYPRLGVVTVDKEELGNLKSILA